MAGRHVGRPNSGTKSPMAREAERLGVVMPIQATTAAKDYS